MSFPAWMTNSSIAALADDSKVQGGLSSVPHNKILENYLDFVGMNDAFRRSHISGMGMSYSSSYPTSVTFAGGAAMGFYKLDGSNVVADRQNFFNNTVSVRKIIGTAWAAGSAAGGIAAGVTLPLVAGIYHCFALGKATMPSSCDFGFDTALNAENLLKTAAVQSAGYVTARHIGWVYYTGTAIKPFDQYDDVTIFRTPYMKGNVNLSGMTTISFADYIPSGLEVSVLVDLNYGEDGDLYFYGLVGSGLTVEDTDVPTSTFKNMITYSGAGQEYFTVLKTIPTNNGSIKIRTSSGGKLLPTLYGWKYNRGRDY